MNISFDQTTDSLNIQLAYRASVDSYKVRNGVILDFDTSGALVGIDLQHTSQRVDLHNLSVSKLPLGQVQAA